MNATTLPESLLSRLFLSKSADVLARDAMRMGAFQLSYQEILELVATTAAQLAEHGVGRGDRVGLIMGNSADYVIAFFAVTSLGAITVPLEEKAGEERMRFILEDTSPRLCLVRPGGTVDLANMESVTLALDWAQQRMSWKDRLLANADTASLTQDFVADQPAVILYSAGSTGQPKGVVLKHRHLMEIATTLVDVVGMTENHRDLIINPLTHSGAWQRVTSTLLAGGCVVFPQASFFSVPALIEEIESHQITGFFTTPPFVRMMLGTAPEKFTGRVASVAAIEIASAPLTPVEMEQLLELFPNATVLYQYGSTECSRALVVDAREEPGKRHTIGSPLRGVTVAILDDNALPLETGQEGEIGLKAPQRTEQFWRRPELDRQRIRNGFLLTGDVGRLDEDGYVTLLGRKDDMINCGGMSYFPAEVEVELGKLDNVAAYLVAGVPDPQRILNQVPWIFIVPEDPETWNADQLWATAREKLPSHMVPRNVVVMPEMPMVAGTKPSRRLATELYGPCAQEG